MGSAVENQPVSSGPQYDALEEARCVALMQDRRGHGQSTLAWYLARALVDAGLRVLIVDVTGRHERLDALLAATKVRNLGIWKPGAPRPEQLSDILRTAREKTRGHVDVILLDGEAALLERAGGLSLPIDYALVLVDPTATGQKTADALAEHLGDAPPPHGRLGAVFSRASESEAEHFPQQTDERHLPILGCFPADYLLAGVENNPRRASQPVVPHDSYLHAVQRLSHTLIRLAGLRRPSAPSAFDGHQPPDSTA